MSNKKTKKIYSQAKKKNQKFNKPKKHQVSNDPKDVIEREVVKVEKVFDTMMHQRFSGKALRSYWTELKKQGVLASTAPVEAAAPYYKELPKDSSKRKGIDADTKKAYTSHLKNLLEEAHQRYGITRFKDITPEHTKAIMNDKYREYQDGKVKQGGKTKSILSAIHLLQMGIRYTSQSAFGPEVKKTMDLGNNEELRKERRDMGVYCSPTTSAGLRVTQEETSMVNDRIKKQAMKTGSEAAKAAHHVSILAQGAGIRLNASINSRPENIVIVKSGKPQFHYPPTAKTAKRNSLKKLQQNQERFHKLPDGVYYQGIDKGNKYNVSKFLPQHEEAIKEKLADFYSSSENYNEKGELKDVPFINMVDENGNKLKNDTIRGNIHDVIKKHSDDFSQSIQVEFKTKDEDGNIIHKMSDAKPAEFSHHRNRGAYALEAAVDAYVKLTGSNKERDEIFHQYRTMDPKSMEKYKANNKKRKTQKLRDLSLKESILFSSFAISHYRVDVTKHYINEDELRSELKKRGLLKPGH